MKKITIEKYNSKMSECIEKCKSLPIEETFIKLIEEASKYKIITKRKNAKKKI